MTNTIQKPHKPAIHPKPHTQAYWDAANEERLLYQFCEHCQLPQFVPGTVCRSCYKDDIGWRESTGKGEVFTFSIIHRGPNASFKDDTPYTLALIDLEEDFRITANIFNCLPESIYIGMPVKVIFEDREGSDYKIPQVEPA